MNEMDMDDTDDMDDIDDIDDMDDHNNLEVHDKLVFNIMSNSKSHKTKSYSHSKSMSKHRNS